MKLNLGSGKRPIKGWINVDLNPKQNPDMMFSVSKYPYPIKNDSVNEIMASHLLEHFTNIQHVEFLNEIYRICKNKAKVTTRVPFYNSATFRTVTDHRLPFNFHTYNKLANAKLDRIVLSDALGNPRVIKRKYKFKVVSMNSKPTKIGRIIPNWFNFRHNLSHVLGHITDEITYVLQIIK